MIFPPLGFFATDTIYFEVVGIPNLHEICKNCLPSPGTLTVRHFSVIWRLVWVKIAAELPRRRPRMRDKLAGLGAGCLENQLGKL